MNSPEIFQRLLLLILLFNLDTHRLLRLTDWSRCVSVRKIRKNRKTGGVLLQWNEYWSWCSRSGCPACARTEVRQHPTSTHLCLKIRTKLQNTSNITKHLMKNEFVVVAYLREFFMRFFWMTFILSIWVLRIVSAHSQIMLNSRPATFSLIVFN